MSETIATLFAALAGLATATGAYLTARRSGVADENRSLEARNDHLDSELTDERIENAGLRGDLIELTKWAYAAIRVASASGLDLPDLPERKVL
ncbi:hypothetical protein GS907_24675 [Rhodococcus hoagii]|nr:hypothetical protein [Prescottella equi]